MKLIRTSLCALFLSPLFINAQQVHWRGSQGALQDDRATAVATTAENDIIVAGYFSQTVDFDIQDAFVNRTAVGQRDLFVQRLDRFGYLQWVVSVGGSGVVEPSAVTVDALGSIIVCGSFSGTIDFDPGSGLTVLSSFGETDAFIMKLSSQGNLIWCRQFGGPSADAALGVSTDEVGRVGVVGFFEYSADINSDGGNFEISANVGYVNGFFMRLSSAGVVDAGQRFTGNPAKTTAIAALPNNQWLIGHTFSSTGTFDPFGNPNNFLEAQGTDMAVSKLEATGTEIWTVQIGGLGNEELHSLVADADGEYLLAGGFSETVNFGSASTPVELASESALDAVVARYGPNGELLWVKAVQGNGDSRATALSISADASVQILGNYTGSCDLDPTDNLQNIIAQGSTDIFRLHLSQEGDFQEAWSYGGLLADYEGGVACDDANNAYVAGAYTEVIDLDASTGSGLVYAEGLVDAYVVKYGSCAKPGLNNPTDVFSTVGSDVSFGYGSSDANFQWQWQVLVGNTYVDLQDDDIHFGVNTADLLIANAPLLLDLTRYRCIVIANGCEFASLSAQLHLNCSTSLLSQSGNVSVNVGEDANFSVFNDVLGANFQWQILQNGNFVDLAESDHYVGVNTDVLTVVGATLSDNNSQFRCELEFLGCIYYTQPRELTVLNAAGIHDASDLRLSVYPNPAEHGEIQLAHAALGSEYFIYSSTGNMLAQGKVSQSVQTIDLTNIASGFYVLKVGEKTASFVVR